MTEPDTAVERLWSRALLWLERRDWDEGATLMVFGAVIGLVTGLTVVGFYRMIDLANLIFIRLPESRLLSFAHALYQPALTAIGLCSDEGARENGDGQHANEHTAPHTPGLRAVCRVAEPEVTTEWRLSHASFGGNPSETLSTGPCMRD